MAGSKGSEGNKGISFGFLSTRNVPEIASRTLTIGSASKLLSLTGWRIGWVTGPKDLVAAVRLVSGYATFCAPTPLQEACATAIAAAAAPGGDPTFGGVARLFEANWNLLAKALVDTVEGLTVCECEGGYFLVADVAACGLQDMAFLDLLSSHCGIAGMPMSLFYGDPTQPCTLVRFAICKKTETIQAAVDALKKWPKEAVR